MKSRRFSYLRFAAVTLLTLGISANATASPLNATWTQVGLMKPDGNMFNGNCNLDLSGSCTVGTVNSGNDFWSGFPSADEILFITGDGKYWGMAEYSTISTLIAANGEVFTPNLQWLDAGENGVSIGAVVGNLLMRSANAEDPWITLQGRHCANNCSEILWGENSWDWGMHTGHQDLMMGHGGVQVYAREVNATARVPEPASLALLGLGLAGLVSSRRKAKQA